MPGQGITTIQEWPEGTFLHTKGAFLQMLAYPTLRNVRVVCGRRSLGIYTPWGQFHKHSFSALTPKFAVGKVPDS